MTPAEREEALARALDVAIAASAIILRVYGEDFDVEYKGKNDPVTRADREANAFITEALARAYPGVPIVAEESDPTSFAGFEAAPRAWFVDPLDGTREFVAKNGEFAVMIGLAEEGRATLGAVAWPAKQRVFGGAEGIPAFELAAFDPRATRAPIHVSRVTDAARARVVASRSHTSHALERALLRLAPAQTTRVGSAGLKAALVACGEADVYLHPGRAGKRWDACAPEAIARAAGGEVTDARGARIDYRARDLSNEHGLLVTNGALHAAALDALGTHLDT